MEDKQAEEIIQLFKDAGMRIELGAQYSVRGQIAQLLNGCEKLIAVLTNAIHSDAQKQCPSCVDADLVNVLTCPKCGYFERR